MQVKYIRFDRLLITALCDWWRPETSTFHFTCGEMTITLADVGILLGLPIEGDVVHNYEEVNVGQICQETLGLVPSAEFIVYNRELKVTWLRQYLNQFQLDEDSSIEDTERYTRGVILVLIASRLFPNHSKGRVSVRWLYLLRDFHTIADYAWGNAVLCHLYQELDVVALRQKNSIAGCLTLLLVCSWTHLPIGRPNITTEVNVQLPYGARWRGERNWRDNPGRHATLYRNELDVMDRNAVVWNPYTNEVLNTLPQECLVGINIWLARTPLICLSSVSMYYPDRVMRQFVFLQHIPDPTEQIFPKGWTRDLYDSYVSRWNHRMDFIQHERQPFITVEEYLSWYWNITRRFVLRQSSTVVDRYIPRGPVEHDLVHGLYMIGEEVDEILLAPHDEEIVKARCFNIKEMIKTLFGRHRLERPPPPQPTQPTQVEEPVREPRTHQRTRQRRQATQEEVDVGTSQPTTQTQTQAQRTRGRGGRGARTPQEIRNLR